MSGVLLLAMLSLSRGGNMLSIKVRNLSLWNGANLSRRLHW